MINSLNKYIGKRMKDARKKNGYTLDNVRSLTKISKQTLINYENGKGNPTLKNILDLCNLYKISPNYLFYGDDNNFDNFSNSLKRKVYSLVSLDFDNDISYDSVKGIISFNNIELKHSFSFCHSLFSLTDKLSRLEIVDKILRYLDNEIK